MMAFALPLRIARTLALVKATAVVPFQSKTLENANELEIYSISIAYHPVTVEARISSALMFVARNLEIKSSRGIYPPHIRRLPVNADRP